MNTNEDQRIAQLSESGKSHRQIAAELGTSPSSVRRRLAALAAAGAKVEHQGQAGGGGHQDHAADVQAASVELSAAEVGHQGAGVTAPVPTTGGRAEVAMLGAAMTDLAAGAEPAETWEPVTGHRGAAVADGHLRSHIAAEIGLLDADATSEDPAHQAAAADAYYGRPGRDQTSRDIAAQVQLMTPAGPQSAPSVQPVERWQERQAARTLADAYLFAPSTDGIAWAEAQSAERAEALRHQGAA